MLSPKNSKEAIPLTPTKLNYYLSQCKKKGKRNDQSHLNLNHSSIQHGYRNDSRSIEKFDGTRSIIFQGDGTEGLACSNLSRKKVEFFDDRKGFSINVPDGAFREPQMYNDSLDHFLTQRSRNTHREEESLYNLKLNQSALMNQSSILNLSPRENLGSKGNLQYFNHHKNEIEPRIKKKVNWRADPPRFERRSIYHDNLEKSFKEISHQLSKITYELNTNSRRLEQMNKLYHQIKKPNPQQSIRRANQKYSAGETKENNSPGFRTRPIVEYEDKVYRDPRFLIWQPLHTVKSQNIFS